MFLHMFAHAPEGKEINKSLLAIWQGSQYATMHALEF